MVEFASCLMFTAIFENSLLRHKDDEEFTPMLLSAEFDTNSTIDPMICSGVV